MNAKDKQLKTELLMESLRGRSSKNSYMDMARMARMNLLERRYNIDAVEKQTLQNALDSLQNNIQIKSRNQIVDRIESITRRSLLKFTDNANTNSLFISSDMFYLEILLDPQSGKVNDVKVHHESSNDSESEPHLVEVLRRGDFVDFTQQLEGFQSIYQLNAEAKIKSKAFIAIQALETDLMNIFNIENKKTPAELMVFNSLGYMSRRRGGHPMRLLFFIRPVELLNFERKKMDGLVDALRTADGDKLSIGNSVTVNLEAADHSNKLQISSLLMKSMRPDELFTYSALNLNNSTLLPAVFVLKLNKPFPLSSQIIADIKTITGGLDVISSDEPVKSETPREQISLINLIITNESQGVSTNGQKGLYVQLADQTHCYFISDNLELTGETVKSIHFTEPLHVSKIITLLRRQAIFNALIGSCVRRHNQPDWECSMYEINVVSLQFVQVFVEHPMRESIVTVEFDLRDVKQPTVKLNGNGEESSFDAKFESYVSRVFEKTLSIPMVVRSMMKLWHKENEELAAAQRKSFNNNGVFRGPQQQSRSGDENSRQDEENDAGAGGSGEPEPTSSSSQNDGSNFTSMSHDGSSFDICGINRNEIFFKTDQDEQKTTTTSQQPPPPQPDVPTMSFESFENKDLMAELVNESSLSPSPPSSVLSADDASSRKLLNKFMQKKSTSLDIFEFNDSPPIGSSLLAQMQSPSTPSRVSPATTSPFGAGEKRAHDIEMMKQAMDGSNSCPSFPFGEKSKSEKKKKRKRDEGEMGSPSMSKKKSSDSLGASPSSKISSSPISGGKPAAASFKPKKSPVIGNFDNFDDLSFLNNLTSSSSDQTRNQFI